VLLRWMPSRLSPLAVVAVSAAAAAADDGGGGGGGGGGDDDDDNDKNFDRRLLSTILDSGTRP